MSETDEPTLIIAEDLLRQVLRNQMAILGLIGKPGHDLLHVAAELLAETDALLDKLDAPSKQ